MRIASTVFGAIFGIIWIGIWIFVVASIIKAVSAQKKVKNVTRDVVNTVQEQLRQVNVHTGDPRGSIYRQTGSSSGGTSADDFSELRPKEKDSETFNSDLNPTARPNKAKRSKTTVNGRKVRGSRIYGVSSSERPAHGKLSRESRDDEKEWF